MTFEEKLKYGNQLIKDDKYLEAFDIFCDLSYERQDDLELSKTALYLFSQIVEGNYDFKPSTANEFLFRGVSRFYKNELDDSNNDYDKALSLNPKLDVAYYHKGLNYGHQKKFELAITEIEKAISLNPNGTYYNEMAQQYFELGLFKECFQYHDKAIEQSPSNAYFWFTYGAHLSKGGLDANALLKLQTAVELDPKFDKAKIALDYVIQKLSRL
jgi:tetratricopeptide (TPR) repeat protein